MVAEGEEGPFALTVRTGELRERTNEGTCPDERTGLFVCDDLFFDGVGRCEVGQDRQVEEGPRRRAGDEPPKGGPSAEVASLVGEDGDELVAVQDAEEPGRDHHLWAKDTEAHPVGCAMVPELDRGEPRLSAALVSSVGTVVTRGPRSCSSLRASASERTTFASASRTEPKRTAWRTATGTNRWKPAAAIGSMQTAGVLVLPLVNPARSQRASVSSPRTAIPVPPRATTPPRATSTAKLRPGPFAIPFLQELTELCLEGWVRGQLVREGHDHVAGEQVEELSQAPSRLALLERRLVERRGEPVGPPFGSVVHHILFLQVQKDVQDRGVGERVLTASVDHRCDLGGA